MKKILSLIIILVIALLYSYNVYNVNKNSDNLRNYKKEKMGELFNAFEGKILVKSIKLINTDDLRRMKNISDYNKKYIDSDSNEYISVKYMVDNVKNIDCLEIKANLDGYIFYDGLPQANIISKNEYEYLIPIPKEKLGDAKNKNIKIFFDNIKVDELEHHYVIFNL